MRKYELMFLIKPSISDSDLSELVAKIESKLGGNIVKKENWGKKQLAYEIKSEQEAIYLLYYVETESNNIDDVKKFSSITKDILRILILKHDKQWPFEAKKLDLSKIKANNKYNKRTVAKND